MQITKIQATNIKTIKYTRVAAYARVSSQKEEAINSLSAQISYYNEYITRHAGWEFVGIYADGGITGTKDTRPEFQRLLADVRAGKIDLIITKSITRLARNTITILETVRELRSLNVDIFFEKENIHSLSFEGDLMLTLLASYAEEEARSASENQKWRIQKLFAAGIPNNSNRMLGYYMLDGVYRIIPEEAEIVRYIFTEYLNGNGRQAIAKALNAVGYKTVHGKQFRQLGIQRILSNEKYTGNMLLQKTYVEDFRDKKIKKNQGERRRYYVKDSNEAIIDQETFDKVQLELKRRGDNKNYHKPKKRSQFSSLLVCDICGKNYTRRSNHHIPNWICQTYANSGKNACPSKQIREEILIEKTLEILSLKSLDGINLRDYLKEIRCRDHTIIYILTNNEKIQITWTPRSRKQSWTDEKRQKASRQARERSTLCKEKLPS